ncbi:MAG: ATP-binding protein, partial [Gammaproteobacteria bacterium]|nr:ATP-binding protein [Gammaproteobacteria bacterium]
TIAAHEVPVILSNCLEAISKVAELMSIKLHCSIMLNCPKINVDPHLINDVLLAMLNNAIIYNHNNGRVDISVSSEDDSSVRITIADDGPGIEKDDFDLIFQPFERLSHSNSTIAGAGVGLTIAKNLTEIMNGKIGFSSEIGVGSTFWVEFPISH